MTFIIIGIIITYLVVIIWTWSSLEDIEIPKKILIIFSGIIVVFLITQIVFSISKNKIIYQNGNVERSISQVIVLLFTGLNSLVLPIICKNIKKRANEEIENNVLKLRMIIILAVFLMCLYLECGYMTDIQQGILQIYKSNIK